MRTVDLRPQTVEYQVTVGAPWWVRAQAWLDPDKTEPRDLTGATITAVLWDGWRSREPVTGAPITVVVPDPVTGVFHFGQPAATVSGVFLLVLDPPDAAPLSLAAVQLDVKPTGRA